MRRAEPFLRSPSHRIVRLAIASAMIGAVFASSRAHAVEPGDSNRDLRISAADMPSLVRILGGQPGNDGADANRDGFVLDSDIVATAARIFGRPVFEPTFTPTPQRTATRSATATPTPSSSMPTATRTTTQAATPTLSPTFGATRTVTATGSIPPTSSRTATPVASFTSSPGATPTPTSTTTITPTASPTRTPTPTGSPLATGTPTATPTITLAVSNTPTPTGTPTRTGTTGAIAVTRCSNTLPSPLPIPDDDLDGVSNSFVVPDNVPIEDLNVRVVIEHTFVGDLFVTLTHEEAKTSVVLLNRAVDAEGQSCDGQNVSATFDDDAARFSGSECSIHDPALGGGLLPEGFLTDFLGESLAGTWRLEIADEAERDVGSLVSWCLEANSTAPVVTGISCNDEFECAVGIDEPFVVEFSFSDRDGNANAYRVSAIDQLGTSFVLEEDVISPPAGDGTVVVPLLGFSCDDPPCDETVFEFFAVVIDEDGQESPFASILVTSLGTK